jgi:hypothetical protein
MKKIALGLSACLAVAVITMGQVPVSVTPGSASQVLAISGAAATPSIAFAAEPSTGFSWPSTGAINVNILGSLTHQFGGGGILLLNGQSGALKFGTSADTVITRIATGELGYTAVAFASLGTPANGTFCYCSDCTIASPCASGGTGAYAKRLNGVWVCN